MKLTAKYAAKVLDRLTDGLEVGESRTIDNSDGVYMPVHVDRLTKSTFSVAHYYSNRGDLVPDPDGTFLKTEMGWLPLALQQCTGRYTVAVTLDADDRPERFDLAASREFASFANVWMKNIKAQQF